MKKFVMISLGLILFLSVFAETEAERLLRMSERTIFPSVYFSTMSMTTQKPGSPERTIVMDSWYKEGVGTLMEISAPRRSKGIRMLQTEGTLWLYNPRSGGRQAIRLSPESSFQGSLFSNDDVGDSQYTDDYSAEIIGSESISVSGLGDVNCRILEAAAKHNKATYGRLLFWVTDEGIPVRMEYYAKSGFLLKVMTLSEIRMMAGKMRPTRLYMESNEQEGFSTTVTIQELEQYDDLPDSKFTRNTLLR